VTTSDENSIYRLPRTAKPSRYELELAPDLEALTFSGSERVEIELSTESSDLLLNADELEIFDATVRPGWSSRDENGEPVPLTVSLDRRIERVRFEAPAPLPAGRYTLECKFNGTLNDTLTGFYRSTFVGDDGAEHTIATTEFEETDARKAFPCFDEPDMKAVFSVTLVAPAGTIAVSNGKEISRQKLEGGAQRVRFADTIVMSTYILAFVVGPLEATPWVDVAGVPVRVVHVPGKEHLTASAIEIADHALRYFSDYFDIAYPAEKLDLVAIPDFASGAMENLGCVIFREADLLTDPSNTSLPEILRVAEVVEHELAHMWFGDLVTMRWWNGAWLNEAFATFMALLCQSDFRPEWHSFLAFGRLRAVGLITDGLSTTRPIEYPVISPDDAAAMFDPPITYYKGGSVLWMVEHFLGHDGFRNGVRRYLKTHAYGNTDTNDLWDALEAENPDVPVRELMESWIFQGGYPLLSVTSGETSGVAELRQAPFSYLPKAELDRRESNIGTRWLVPVLAASVADRSTSTRVVLRDPERIDVGSSPIVVNADGAGFYRVHYDEKLLSELIGSFSVLEPLERLDLISDTWAAVQSGWADVGEFFDLVRHLGDETDPHIWSLAVAGLRGIDRVAPEIDREPIADFTRGVLRPVLDRIGFVGAGGDNDEVSFLRGVLIGALGTLGEDRDVVSRARKLFESEREPGGEIDANIAPAIYATVASHATREEFDAILHRFRQASTPLQERRYERAFAYLRDLGFAHEVHELCRTEIRSQDAPYLLALMMHQRSIGPATWEFVVEHFDELERRYPANSIDRMLEGIASLADLDGRGEPLFEDAVRTFVDQKITGARRRPVDQSVEQLEVNLRLARRLRTGLRASLASH